MFETLLLQQLAWIVAGAACGLLVVSIAATFRSSQKRTEAPGHRRDLWDDLLDDLDALERFPEVAEVKERAAERLRAVSETERPMEVITLLLSLQPGQESVMSLVRSSGLVDQLVLDLENGTAQQKIASLELIGLTNDRSHLSTVLVHCTAREPEVRRVALRLLCELEPATALDLHVRAARIEGPWVIEQLADLVADADAVSQFRSLHGDRRLADAVALLANEVANGDERRGLAAIEALGRIDHRSSVQALTHGLRASSAILADAARRTLAATEEGRAIVARVEGTTTPAANPTAGTAADDGLMIDVVSGRASTGSHSVP